MEHRALDLLHSSDVHVRIDAGIWYRLYRYQ